MAQAEQGSRWQKCSFLALSQVDHCRGTMSGMTAPTSRKRKLRASQGGRGRGQ